VRGSDFSIRFTHLKSVMPEYKFIPRGETRVPKYKESYGSKFTLLSFIIFFIAFGGYGAAYFYKWYLNNQVAVFSSSFEKVKSELELESISEIIDKSKEIAAALRALQNHRAISNVFESIEKNTTKNNFYILFSFKYGEEKTSSGQIKTTPLTSLSGVSKSYSDLAKQMIVSKNSGDFEKADFSDFKLLLNGDISYNLDLRIKPELLKF